MKILRRWHYLYRGVDLDGQVLDCWLSQTRDLAAAEAFFRRTIAATGCTPEHVVTDKATFYPSAIRTCAPGAKHTPTGFYNLVISTNRCGAEPRLREVTPPSHARTDHAGESAVPSSRSSLIGAR